MKLEDFSTYIDHPELLNNRTIQELINIVEEYPFFQTARLLLLKNLHNQGDIRYEKELKKTAIWTTDRKKLFYLLDSRVLLSVQETETPIPAKTIAYKAKESTIGDYNYFDKKETKQTTQKDELEELIMAGTAATGTFFNVDDNVDLESFKSTFSKTKNKKDPSEQESKSIDRNNELIDSFIINNPKISKPKEDIPLQNTQDDNDQASSNEMITDTLAKIYIKQGFFEKAINAYEKLSLKYPEKNAYFADQIKKIKKNINN